MNTPVRGTAVQVIQPGLVLRTEMPPAPLSVLCPWSLPCWPDLHRWLSFSNHFLGVFIIPITVSFAMRAVARLLWQQPWKASPEGALHPGLEHAADLPWRMLPGKETVRPAVVRAMGPSPSPHPPPRRGSLPLPALAQSSPPCTHARVEYGKERIVSHARLSSQLVSQRAGLLVSILSHDII